MQYSKVIGPVLGIAALAALASSATAHDNKHNRPEVIRAVLIASNEVPSVASHASGTFRAVIDEDLQIINYKLQYSGLEGGDTLFAHIHLGERHTNGGVMVFLCGGSTKPAACPNGGGTVEGSIVAADVLALGPPPASGQQVAAGGFDELLELLRTPGQAYVNVHTTASPGGEIRGQVF